MKKTRGRLLSLVLAVLLCVAVLPTGSARAMGDAMSLDQVKALMNAETLYPQKTGYIELDRMLEELVAPYKGKDTYTTLKGLYDWTVNNIDYSWDGYSQNYAPAYDCFTLTYDLTYETGLPQAYPIDMIYRAYHMLTARTGVCYDWGILFAVMARYVGVESYVHTGILRIGTWTGHHGWTELRLGGKNYIFDGQQDWRSKGIYGYILYDHFGISMDNAWRMLYEPDVGLIKLFTPPFQGQEQPGYIAAYLPGVRENGGQYTHAACWAVAALHQLGQDGRAWELASALLPIRHAATRQLALRYRVEPYALAADVYANPQQRGRGGWTWYTGSASWLQYVVLTQLLGFQKTGNVLRFRPVAPSGWDELRVTYRFGTATYHLHASRECPFPTADGEQLRDGRLILTDDGRIHEATFPLR